MSTAAPRQSRPRVAVATEVYFPDESGTSHLVTELARAMAVHADVRVVTSTPGAATDGLARVDRVGKAPQKGQSLPARAWAVLRRSLVIAREACRASDRREVIFVVFGPTLLPYLVAAMRPRGTRVVVIVHDIYPHAAVAGGMLAPRSRWIGPWNAATKWMLRRADRCIAIGHDMGDLLGRLEPRAAQRIAVIPHWVDAGRIQPAARASSALLPELGIRARVVLEVAGNLGRTHGIDDLLEAERMLRGEFTRDDLVILALGSGAHRARIEAVNAERGSLLVYGGQRARRDEQDFLAAADLCFVGYSAGMTGVSVPSRVPAILSAGRAILAVTDAHSDLGRLVTQRELGWCVAPGDSVGLAAAIRAAVGDPARLKAMGSRARLRAEELDDVARAALAYLDAAGVQPVS